ncbi:MAG: hypothetical protein V1908_00290 [Candidatus Peregrinibacteria bacterium]
MELNLNEIIDSELISQFWRIDWRTCEGELAELRRSLLEALHFSHETAVAEYAAASARKEAERGLLETTTKRDLLIEAIKRAKPWPTHVRAELCEALNNPHEAHVHWGSGC